MSQYKIQLTKKAEKQLDKLPEEVADSLLKTIATLRDNPRPQGTKKLKGRKGYRLRKGDYRIIYEIFNDRLVIDVIAIGHRKDIYR